MTNLFTSQAGSLLLVDTDPVLVHTDSYGGEFHWYTDEYGRAEGHPNTDYHGWATQKCEHSLQVPRPCVHLLSDPYPCNLFGTTWVNKLRWQPTLYLIQDTPVIAARRGLHVTLMWDCRGPLDDCENTPTNIAAQNKFTYELHPVVWDDETVIATGVLIGVQS